MTFAETLWHTRWTHGKTGWRREVASGYEYFCPMDPGVLAWKSGQTLATIPGDVPVETFDARWRDGQKRSSFDLLSEETVEGRPTFRVRIPLTGGDAVEDTFVVVGSNPLLVFRKQDFDKAGGL